MVANAGNDRKTALIEANLALAAVCWGLNYAATKYATGSLPPILVVGLRFALGGLLLLVFLRLLQPKGGGLGLRDGLALAALGCFGVGAAQTCFTYGLSLTTASNTGLIFATAPVWGMILGLLLGTERPSLVGVVGVALSIFGVGLVVREGLGAPGTSLSGDLLILLAAVAVGAYTALSVPMLEKHTPLEVATYPAVFAAPPILALSLPVLPGVEWGDVGLGIWAAVGYSAVLGTAFAFSAWQQGINRLGANRVLVYQYLITLMGVASGVVFFGETLGAAKIAGGAIILLGIYLARRQ